MSDSAQASYAKIGFFILVGLALIAGTLIYLGGMGSKQHEFIGETFFSDPVWMRPYIVSAFRNGMISGVSISALSLPVMAACSFRNVTMSSALSFLFIRVG